MHINKENGLTNFIPLISYGVNISLFNKQVLNTFSQPKPDVVLAFKRSTFKDQRVHGMDQKSGTSFIMNLICSNITDQLYADRTRCYESILRFNNPNLSNLDEIALALS